MLHSRDRRIEESIKQALAHTIQFETNDPRVPPIFTITHVAVSKDMRHAKVFYSQFPDDDELLERTGEFLRDSAGFLRTRIAHQVNLKFTPELHFAYDPSHREYDRINAKLLEIQQKQGPAAADAGEDEDHA